MKDACIKALALRGVTLEAIVDVVFDLQAAYFDHMDRKEVMQDIVEILDKREVYHALMTGIALDIAVEKGCLFDDHLMEVIRKDEGLYGVDEVLAYGICNLYGSIALTNFGYVDKLKPGIIQKVNDDPNQCNTFLDDIIGAIAASAASKIAHTHRR